jgi:immunity protein 52 of polymorphic toxin system
LKSGPYEVATYGGPRQESPRACAVHFARMATALSAIHPAFARWKQQGDTAREADIPFCAMPPDIGELTKTIENGRHVGDISREVMAHLGYALSAWNAIGGPAGVWFRMNVGAYSATLRFPNQVHFMFRRAEDANQDLLSPTIMKAVLLTLIDAWEPDWAILTEENYARALFERGPLPLPLFRAGWMTYLSAPYARKFRGPPEAILEPVAGGGILILSTKERFTIDDPDHVIAADAIQEALTLLETPP